jgi:putative addiction module CopG family antidote
MALKLPPDLREYIDEKLASGEYSSRDEVIAHALKVMRRVEEWLPSAQDELQREIQIGLDELDAGKAEPWDVQEMKARLRAQYGRK